MSLADVERLVCSSGIRYPAFRLVKEGAKIEVGDYTVDLPWRPVPFARTADVGRVLEEFEEGATIVLQGLHLHWEPLAVFCRNLERELEHPAQANAYFTPRDSQGLAVHHDTHDVFVLQLAGEKRWLIYEPVWPLPLKNQRYKSDLGSPGAVALDITLRPGDTLYLPRGWLHEAVTSGTDSLHVTVGINVYSWLDAFKAALKECAYDLAFRRTPDGGDADELVERLRERLSPDDVARRRRRRLVKTRRPILGDQLSQLRALGDLGVETPVERRPTVLAELVETAEGVGLTFEGKELTFPPAAASDVQFAVQADGPFRPSDLPGELDERSRLVLVRRLVREGFLRLSQPDARSPRSDGAAGP